MAFDASDFTDKLLGWYDWEDTDENVHTPGTNDATEDSNGYVSGLSGKALRFFARYNREVYIPKGPAVHEFGIAFWAKLSGFDNNVLGGSTHTTYRPTLRSQNSVNLTVQFYHNNNWRNHVLIKSDYAAVCTSWNHVAYSFSTVTGNLTTWFNGARTTTHAMSAGELTSSSNASYSFYGTSQPATYKELLLDQVVTITGEEFSDDEVSWLYNGGTPRAYADLGSSSALPTIAQNNQRVGSLAL